MLLLSIIARAASASVVFQDPYVELLNDCSNYNGLDSCKGSQVDYPEEDNKRIWQTPPKGSKLYHESFMDYSSLQGYAQVIYGDGMNSATVKILSFVKKETKVECFFDGIAVEKCSKQYTKKDFDEAFISAKEETKLQMLLEGVQVEIRASELDAKLVLDPIYFVWQNVPVNAPNTENGQKGAIVELFGWPFEDVEKECKFLGNAGYLGVKIFPSQEHVESYHQLQNGELNPWYFQYQPVSYRLNSRMGTRAQLRKMIVTCRSSGVRVYADAVVNHMSGGGNDVWFHRINRGSCVTWGPKNATSGSPYFTHSFTFDKNPYTNERPALEYPAVPYWPTHFHCDRPMNDWASGFSLNYGWLSGLTDLNTEHPYVQQRIADYLTDLMGIGFSGYRIDAAKHIKPDDLAAIFSRFKKNMGNKFPVDFISWLEVIIGGEKGLLACDYNPYNYYKYLDGAMLGAGLTTEEVSKIKIWSSDYPKEFPICGHWVLPEDRFVIQNDDHDQQNPGSSSRDMGDKGSVLIKERDIKKHRHFEKELFNRGGNWKIRLILSGFTFMNNGAQGYPDGKSDCKKYKGLPENCKSVPFRPAYVEKACGYSMQKNGQWLEGEYTRVHRDQEIINSMRNWLGLGAMNEEELAIECK